VKRISLLIGLVVMGSILAGFSETAGARIIYVRPGGSDTNTGLAWDQAKQKVTAGLTAAVSGDQVWVAAGTYSVRITLKAGVALYGGFAGTETQLSQRNISANPTILEDGQETSHTVTSPSEANATTRIDGFIIRNRAVYGSGIYCVNSSPSITNNTITQNRRSGIYCSSSSPVIENNVITGNSSTNDLGGGIYCSNSSPTIRNNVISGNHATYGGYGGGICFEGASTAIIENNAIIGNLATYGGAISCSSSSPTIRNNIITGNSASFGGGIYCYSSSPKITNNTFKGNSASSGGGGAYCDTSSPAIANNIIAFNNTGLFRRSDHTGTPTLYNNCVYNPAGANYTNLSPGTGDINQDPGLEAPEYDRYHLKTDSLCINTGDDTLVPTGQKDMDGLARTVGSHVDIGADENDGTVYSFTPAIIRVSLAGDDANDGSTWPAAKRTVQAGIDAAAVAGGEVWLAEGIYFERITLKAYAYLYGGFAGTETERSHRNFKTHPAVLDGQMGGSVVTATSCGYQVSGIDGVTIRNGTGTESNYVVYGGGICCTDSSPVFANLTIRVNTASTGGGIYCGLASPVIENCVINGNCTSSTGGGISCSHSFPTVRNCTIVGNTARYGGGIDASYSSPLIVNNIVALNATGIYRDDYSDNMPVLRNNCVYNPGGVDYTDLSPGEGDINLDPKLEAPEYGKYHLNPDSPCIDAGNDADVQAGGLDMDNQIRTVGSHIDIGADEYDGTVYPFTPSIIHVSLSGNDANDGSTWALAKRTVQKGLDTASAAGGEVWVAEGVYYERINLQPYAYLYGGFAGTETGREQRNFTFHPTILDGQQAGSVVTATHCGDRVSRIDGLTLRNGKASFGGGILCSSSLTIANNTISGNSASDGGGIFCSSLAVIANNTIIGNAATNSNPYSYGGGGIFCVGSSPSIMNNTICGNTAGHGGGISCLSSPSIINNIIAFNSSGICFLEVPPLALRNNCVYNPDGDNYTGMVGGGTGDINVDPLFVDRLTGNYHLSAGSPCINMGNDSDVQSGWLDMDGQARINETHVDMGADEYYAPAGYAVTGRVTLQYRLNPGATPVTVAVRQGGQTVRTETLDLDSQGNYTIANVAPGGYSLLFSASKFLKKAIAIQVIDQNLTNQNVTLFNADYDGDNEVTVFDINMILLAFWGIEGEPGWDPAADMDGDGEITVFDVNIVLLNFGMIGDE